MSDTPRIIVILLIVVAFLEYTYVLGFNNSVASSMRSSTAAAARENSRSHPSLLEVLADMFGGCKPKKKCDKKCGKCIASPSCGGTFKEFPNACRGNSCVCCAPQVCCKENKTCRKKGGTCEPMCPEGHTAESGCRGKSCVCCIKIQECTCGQANPIRVVGGEVVAPKNKYPWHVWIKAGGDYLCGGSIINNRYILTAAHCLFDLWHCNPSKPKTLKVVVADHNKDSTDDDVEATRTISVDKVIVHPGYDCKTELYDDIGLLRLSQSLNLTSEQVRPVCLPKDDSKSYKGEMAVVTGWGYTEGYGPVLPSLLHEVELPVIKCPSPEDYGEELTPEMICAGKKNEGLDACNGDSGGPLVVRETNSQYVQVGIVSFGPLECKGPGIYTRVSKYLKWIKRNTRHARTCS